MKRLITLLLALVLAFTVTGCKKKPAETSTPETTSSSNTQSDNNSSDNESTSTDNTNTEPSSIDNNTALNSNTSSINNSPLSQNNSASENTSSQNSEKDDTNSDNESTSSDNTNTEPSNTNDNSSTDNTSSDTQNTSSDVSSETPPDNENEYKNISCRNVGNDEWKTADVSVNGNKQLYVNLSIPSDWDIYDYISKRNGLQIGVISDKLVDTSAATYEKSEKNDSNDTSVLIRSSVEKYEINGTSQFKRFFKVTKFSDKNGTNICIYVDYAELDDAASNKLYNSILTVNYTKSE